MRTALLCFTALATCQAATWDPVVNGLLTAFERYDLVALGEWHGSRQDSELRLALIRHPQFARKVRYIVFEAASARHQSVLDRFIRGESVPHEQVRDVWRDITTPGGADSPVYEAFLSEVRALNARLPPSRALRVLAADPAVDWATLDSRERWAAVASRRDAFAVGLIEREVLSKGAKALIISGSGHLWQRNQIVREPNLAALIKQAHPGKLYTAMRIDPAEGLNAGLPAFTLLPLDTHRAGGMSARDAIGFPQLFAPDVKLRDVIDAAVFTAIREPPAPPPAGDAAWETEKLRRRKLIERR